VYHGDITEGLTSYPDGSFDCVSLIRTLELLVRPEPVLEEMLRVGRTALVTFTNYGHLKYGARYLFTGAVPGAKSGRLSGPPSRLTLPLFRAYCRKQGIEVRALACLPSNWRTRFSRGWFSREFAAVVARSV
jgi:methionine biosynthesis protein MetW